MSCSNNDIIQTSLCEGWKIVYISTTTLSSRIPVTITVSNTSPYVINILAKGIPIIFRLEVNNKRDIFNDIFSITGPLDMDKLFITISD